MTSSASQQPHLVQAPQFVQEPQYLLAALMSSYSLSKLRNTNVIEKVQPGLYSPASTRRTKVPEAQYFSQLEMNCQARIEHASSRFPDSAVSHHSAAFLHGLPIPNLNADVAMIDPRQRTTSPVGVVRHRVAISERDVECVRGIPRTDLLRTTVDCARSFNAPDGLAVLDEALNHGVPVDYLHALNNSMPSNRGRAKARWLFDAGVVGVDSPMESRLRFILLCAGFGDAVIQFPIPSFDGRVFFADIAFPSLGIIFEYDGRAKYGAAADLIAEKAREDAIRLRGWKVVRVQASEIRDLGSGIEHFRRIAKSLGLSLGPVLRLPFKDSSLDRCGLSQR